MIKLFPQFQPNNTTSGKRFKDHISAAVCVVYLHFTAIFVVIDVFTTVNYGLVKVQNGLKFVFKAGDKILY